MTIASGKRVALCAVLVALLALCGSAGRAAGQTYDVLHAFNASVRITSALVEVAPGEFYGTTDQGGAWGQGSVVKVTTAGTVTTLHSFDSNTDGQTPVAGLVYDGAGFLYGTTTSGGLNGFGTVFRVSPDGSTFETVHDFAGGTGPASPEAALIKGSDGNFYGTSRLGGANGLGTVFSLDLSTSPATLTTLYSFSGGATDGASPVASLFESGGFLYGTTYEGGNGPGLGTIFKISTSGSMQWVTPFPSGGLGGASPKGGVVEKGGVFYGTTEAGGTAGAGTVFMVTDAGVLTTVYEFGSKGAIPEAGLTLGSDGKLYGTTKSGGANFRGTVFRIDPSATPVVEQTLHSFNDTNGRYPTTGLALGSDGKLYGTTSDGGAGGYGTSYAVDPAALPPAAFAVIYEDPGTEGFAPFSPLYRDGNGDLFGTTSLGGNSAGGTIYRLESCATPPCTLTTLRATQDLGVGQDFSGVVPGPGGFLYGTTKGSNSVYKIQPDGSSFQTLYTFTGTPGNFPNGSFPIGVMERGGILYGATAAGGASDKGTLFKVDPASPGSLGWSTSFSGTDGRYPSAQLVAGSDGKLYGVASGGGPSDKGTLFRVATDGTVEHLYSFSGPDGSGPWAALTPAGSGIFYGTTGFGGDYGLGTFFRLDAATSPVTVTTLRDFATGEVEGVSVLTLGDDGNLYGTSQTKGANGLGAVIQLAPSGALRTLYSFSGPDGAYPRGGVLRLPDGTLLGTAEMAGPLDGGVAFRLLPATSSATASVSGGGVTTCAGGNVVLTVTLTGTAPWTLSWSDGVVQSVSSSPATRTVTLSVSTVYTLTAFSDANGDGTVSGSASVTVSGAASSTAITAPASAPPNTTGLVASVPDAGGGATYLWAVTNGSLTSGQGTRSITFSAGSGGFVYLTVTVSTGPTCSASGSAAVAVGNAAADSITFTRLAGAPGGPGAVDANGTASRFNQPTAVAFGPGNVLYVADAFNQTIRRVSSSGDVTTLAGLARVRGSADGTGSSARFWNPRGLALDAAGNLYVSDHYNHTIRKVTPTGVVSTYLGLAGSFGNAGGTGSSARLHYPAGLAVDLARNVLYVAERGSHVIRRVDLATGEIFPYAGLAGSYGNADGAGGAARFFAPLGLTIDGSGTLYVADASNQAVRKVARAGAPTGSEGDVTTLASGFVSPDGLAADGLGNLYLADSGNRTIRKIVIGTGAVSTVAGQSGVQGTEDGTGSAARFFRPTGVAVDSSGNAWIADGDYVSFSTSIRKVTPSGVVTTTYGAPSPFGFADLPTARFNTPRGVAADPGGNVLVADTFNHSIRKITPAGDTSTLAGPSVGLNLPMGVAVDTAGNTYVGDTMNHVIRKITSGGAVSILAGAVGSPGDTDGPPGDARFNFPWGLAVDAAGNVYVADSGNSRIRKITPTGVTTLPGAYVDPRNVAVDAFGNVFVADSGNCAIRKISSLGVVTTLAGLVGSCGYSDGNGGAARFYLPTGIALDALGNVYVTEINDNRIRKVTPAGDVTTTVWAENGDFGSEDGTDHVAHFFNPEGIAVDPSGNLIVADTANHSIRIGRPALADAATIDSTTGLVGAVRQLGTSPQTATSWNWEVIRRPAGSTAALSSASVRNPTFTPDVADLFIFRLTASDATKTSITLAYLSATPVAGATATVSGGGTTCAGGSTQVRVTLTGTPPWNLTWSDGVTQNGVMSSPVVRTVSPALTTTYSLTAFSDALGAGAASGSATVTVLESPTPAVTATWVRTPASGWTASVPFAAGRSWAWTVTNGSIVSGQGTNEIFVTRLFGGAVTITVVETVTATGCSAAATTAVGGVRRPYR
ncbi:MAG TPA: hypothetical protein PLB02_04455 [Thermoanaerobaculia bacterium]|nr:hypothetical protein [Thermoanaerobaculia bacterium]HQR66623.1 hypothetical protein [Thermoanaerobaculia bacterium]